MFGAKVGSEALTEIAKCEPAVTVPLSEYGKVVTDGATSDVLHD